jgi:hypothetical protein
MLAGEILGLAAHVHPVADVAEHRGARLHRDIGGYSVRIVGALQQHRRHRATQHQPGDAPGYVPSEVADNLRCSHGMTDQK